MAGITDVYNYLAGLGDMSNPSGTLQGQANGMIVPALATAAKQYSDAGQYADAGERAAQTANPFGDRSFYKNKLQSMYTDPNYIMSDPSYQWRLNQGMANVNRVNNSQGYQGSGKSNIDLVNYAQNAASQEWDKEHTRLYDAAGGKFSPAEAAKYIMQGNELKLGAENNALASLFYPALMQGTANTIQNQTGGVGGGGAGSPGTNTSSGPSQSQLAQWAQAGYRFVTDGRGGGDLFDSSGKQIGTLDQNGNLVPSYPTDPNDPRLDTGGYTPPPVVDPYNPGTDPTSPYNQNDTSPYYPPNTNDDISTYIPPDIADQYFWDYTDNGGG